MNTAAESIVLALVIAMYVGLPVVIIWGWLRWAKSTQSRTLFSVLSLIGFTLATASALLAISSLAYAWAIRSFPFWDPLLMRIYRLGGLLSLAGIVFGATGMWRSSPLRWHAPACGLGMLLFWFIAALGE